MKWPPRRQRWRSDPTRGDKRAGLGCDPNAAAERRKFAPRGNLGTSGQVYPQWRLLAERLRPPPPRVARQVFHPAIGPLQRGQGLLVPLRVPDEMQRNQRIVKHVSHRMRSRDVQRVSVVDDRLFVGVSFLEPPSIRDSVIAVVQDQLRCWSRFLRRFVYASSFFSATDRPNFLA